MLDFRGNSPKKKSLLVTAWMVVGIFAAGVTVAPLARAMDPDVQTVLLAGEYGLAGGTILGVASLPMSRDVRTIFIGSSVGLYLGIAVGLYFVFSAEPPEDRFRTSYLNNARSGDPQIEFRRLASVRTPAPREHDWARDGWNAHWTVLRF
ncbi:hypothetical protein WDW37_12355 [Bdellovibrionota bacterium FG-1]